MRSSSICLICSLFFAKVALAQDVVCGLLKQGEPLLIKTDGGHTVFVDGRQFSTDSDGNALIGVDRSADQTLEIKIKDQNGRNTVFALPIAETQWDEQKVNGVAPRKVTPSASDEKEIVREQTDVQRALTTEDLSESGWKNGFAEPIGGRISGHFGNRRVFNGIPKNPHTGTDIAAPEGRVVRASADGKVVLSGGPYFYGGNMVIIDHGNGLQTIYMHLSKRNVAKGDKIRRGDDIGLVGHTGRATGPHLHWGASVHNTRVRPHGLIELSSAQCRNLADFRKDKP